MQDSERLLERLEPLLAEAGLALVELAAGRSGGSLRVRMTIYSPGGTGTDECAKAHRIAYPVVEEVLGSPEPELEVSSPGIDRILRGPREWAVFVGKGVRVLFRDEAEWVKARIEGVEGGRLRLALADGPIEVGFEDVAKARLDSSADGPLGKGGRLRGRDSANRPARTSGAGDNTEGGD
jgi:ribosome maturation factor RimP